MLDMPGREARQHAHQSRQQDEAEADAVNAEVILDVKVGNPGATHDEVGFAPLCLDGFRDVTGDAVFHDLIGRRALGQRCGGVRTRIGVDRKRHEREREA